MEDYETLTFEDAPGWRRWLARNHDTTPGVWLVFYRKGTGKSLDQSEAAVEALAYGWIDSIVHKLDENRFIQRFTPRKAGSTWSATNKERVNQLIIEGRMTEAGMAKVREAQADGSWDSLTDVDNLVVPEDLAAALAANPRAAHFFERLNASNRKMYIYWIATAKRHETRQRRIAETVRLLAAGKRTRLE